MTLRRGGWAQAELSDTLIQLRTGPFGSAVHKYDYVAGGVPLINPMHIKAGVICPSSGMAVDERKAAELVDFALAVDDVVLGRRGEMGRCAVVTAREEGWLIGTGSMALTPSEAITASFLQKYLSSREVVAALEGSAVGSTMVNLNQSILLRLPIDLPPAAEQRRIVAKLDALTALLTGARAELGRVPILADRLRDAALTTVRESTRQAPQCSVSGLSLAMFDGPFGSNLKSADYADDGARVVRLENIGHLRFNGEKRTFISLAKYTGLTRHALVPGDILFSSFVDREVRVCRFPEDISEPAINKADCFAIRPDETKCDGNFLTYMLAAPATYKVMKEAVHGATRPRIGLSHLKNYQLHIPSLEAQREYAAQLDTAFARADRLEAEAARARALLDRLEAAILAKAFRGELVPQDPEDEPASVLLERIRAQRAAAPKAKRGRRAREAADA